MRICLISSGEGPDYRSRKQENGEEEEKEVIAAGKYSWERTKLGLPPSPYLSAADDNSEIYESGIGTTPATISGAS